MLFSKKTEGKEPDQAEIAEQSSSAPADATADRSGAQLSEEEAKKRGIAAKRAAAAFGEIVVLLMRSPSDKHHALSDLEWLVVPAVAHGQYALAEAQSKATGATTPVGAVLWALVSEEVDKRLSDLSTPVRLKPDEWRSGDIPWIVQASGDMKILGGLIQPLTQNAFQGRSPKMRVRNADGKVSVGQLDVKSKTASDA